MSQDAPMLRHWLLVKMLSSRRLGVSVAEMAAELKVNPKTIRRDLQTFESIGMPLEETVRERGLKTWRIKTTDGQPDLSFALDEALALYLGRRFMEPLAGTYLWQAAQSAYAKIRACLGQKTLAYLEKMAATLHQTSIGISDYSRKGELIDQLMRAIEDRKVALVLYQSMSATEPVEYELCPYGLTFHRGSLYLVARSNDHGEVRHFKVDRMTAADVTAFPFQLPEDFDIVDHFAGSFGVYQGHGDVKVKVRFLPKVARYVQESQWHASQQLEVQHDGSVLAEFRLSNTEEIKRWLLSFGQNVEVLQPASLRQDLALELHAMLQLYRDGQPNHPEGSTQRGATKTRRHEDQREGPGLLNQGR